MIRYQEDLKTLGVKTAQGYFALDENIPKKLTSGTYELCFGKIEIPSNVWGFMTSRSRLNLKGVFTQSGILDPTFNGELSALINIPEGKDLVLRKNDSFHQIVYLPFKGVYDEKINYHQGDVRGTYKKGKK